jgi:hypothetical protein
MIDHTGRNLYLILIPNSVTDQNDLTQITCNKNINVPITVGAPSEAWNVFVRLDNGMLGSNPTRGKNVCFSSVFVLFSVGRGLQTAWSPMERDLPTAYNILKFIINSEWEPATELNPSRQ